MTLHHIKVFCAVCQEGSMSKAATRLNMTQPGVSRIIAELESHYTTVLFVRKNRGLTLTASGALFYKDSLRTIQDFQHQEANIRHGQKSSAIVFGCTTVLGSSVAYELQNRFQSRYPDCVFYVKDNTSHNIQEMVLSEECNIAMVQNFSKDDRLHHEVFCKDSLVAVRSPEYRPLQEKASYSIKDLAKEKLLLMEKGRTTRNMLENIAMEKGVVLEPVWTSAAVSNLKELCLRGKGVTVVFEMMVRSDIQDGRLVKLPLSFTAKRDFHLIYRNDTWLSEEEEYLLELCRHWHES